MMELEFFNRLSEGFITCCFMILSWCFEGFSVVSFFIEAIQHDHYKTSSEVFDAKTPPKLGFLQPSGLQVGN